MVMENSFQTGGTFGKKNYNGNGEFVVSWIAHFLFTYVHMYTHGQLKISKSRQKKTDSCFNRIQSSASFWIEYSVSRVTGLGEFSPLYWAIVFSDNFFWKLKKVAKICTQYTYFFRGKKCAVLILARVST
jgi:hypothetical protein